MPKSVCISVVCYNNENEVIAFGKKLSRQNYENIFLVVTCNSTTDFAFLENEINKLPFKTLIIEPPKNLGYLNGCLFGLRTLGKIDSFDWIIMCNTDIDFYEDDFFSKLVEEPYEDSIWCQGPSIMLASNNIQQNPFLKKRPSKGYILRRYLSFINYYIYCAQYVSFRLKRRALNSRSSCAGGREQHEMVYAVHGSFFILRSGLVQKLLNTDNSIFMYGEELFIAELAEASNKKTMVNWKLHVIHNENQTTSMVTSKLKQQWKKTSMCFIYKNFFK